MGELVIFGRAVHALFALFSAYIALRIDARDRPLALLISYVWLSDAVTALLVHSWSLWQRNFWVRISLGWLIDVLFVSWFVAHYVVALRYRRGSWPSRPVFKLVLLVLVTLAVFVVHLIQRRYFGLGPWDVGVRWIGLRLICLLAASGAAFHLMRRLQTGEVAPAHLLLLISIALSLIQFTLALRPQAWRMDLYQIGVLVFHSGGLLWSIVRIARWRVVDRARLVRNGMRAQQTTTIESDGKPGSRC